MKSIGLIIENAQNLESMIAEREYAPINDDVQRLAGLVADLTQQVEAVDKALAALSNIHPQTTTE